jgi:hypothetical protein
LQRSAARTSALALLLGVAWGAEAQRFCLVAGTSRDAGAAIEADHDARATAVALASLPRRRAEEVRLRRLVDRLVAKAHPLGLDLEGGDPAGELRRWFGAKLPSFTAADALLRARWVAADGSLSVRLETSCRDGAPALPERAAFLAWPITRAVVLEVPSPLARGRLVARLRAAAARGGSTVALVLTARDLISSSRNGIGTLRPTVRRLVRLLQQRGPLPAELWPLRAIAGGTFRGRLSSRLQLRPREILIVPRLSALARLPSFVGEIDSRLDELGMRQEVAWNAKP